MYLPENLTPPSCPLSLSLSLSPSIAFPRATKDTRPDCAISSGPPGRFVRFASDHRESCVPPHHPPPHQILKTHSGSLNSLLLLLLLFLLPLSLFFSSLFHDENWKKRWRFDTKNWMNEHVRGSIQFESWELLVVRSDFSVGYIEICTYTRVLNFDSNTFYDIF